MTFLKRGMVPVWGFHRPPVKHEVAGRGCHQAGSDCKGTVMSPALATNTRAADDLIDLIDSSERTIIPNFVTYRINLHLGSF